MMIMHTLGQLDYIISSLWIDEVVAALALNILGHWATFCCRVLSLFFCWLFLIHFIVKINGKEVNQLLINKIIDRAQAKSIYCYSGPTQFVVNIFQSAAHIHVVNRKKQII